MSKATIRKRDKNSERDRIVIDENKGLVFSSEDELYKHFLPDIQKLEKEHFEQRTKEDFPVEEFDSFAEHLEEALNHPDEVWKDSATLPEQELFVFFKQFKQDDHDLMYVAICYRTEEIPSFIYLHFPTKDGNLVEFYRRGELMFNRATEEVEKGAVDGDALSEGDELAIGLYKAMLKLRSDKDIQEEKFSEFQNLREDTIQEPDEIWRNHDLSGNVLVSFIRDFSETGTEGLHYIVVTVEDSPTNSHALLFSFPTVDQSLVDRYRNGENLQADEVTQEASH